MINMTHETGMVFDAALSLPMKDRAELAGKLLESLGGMDDHDDIEKAWVDEAFARLKAYDEGKMEAYPLNEVLQRLRQG